MKERFDLIARMSAHGMAEVEESDAVRLARSMADPLRIRQLLQNSASGNCPVDTVKSPTGSALSHILPALERRASGRSEAPVSAWQRQGTKLPVVSTKSAPEEEAVSRFNPSRDDLTKAVSADAGNPKVKQRKPWSFGTVLILVLLGFAISLSLWLFH